MTLSRQLSWSHFVSLIPLKDPSCETPTFRLNNAWSGVSSTEKRELVVALAGTDLAAEGVVDEEGVAEDEGD